MKRFVLAILLVTAVAASVFVVLNRPGAEASPDVTITVDSTADTNTRDAKLTLREAMMLATGALPLDELTQGECNQVSETLWTGLSGCFSGTVPPGVGSADTIVFDSSLFSPGIGAFIPLGDTLPTLDTGDDTVDGSTTEVTIRGGATDTFGCFEITSDYNSIKGMEIYNCRTGVTVKDGAHYNTIGGSSPGEGNVISGNGGSGVSIIGSGTNGNVVMGNLIGTDASGTAAMGNGHYGVVIEDGPENNTIGGTGSGEGNIIAFNQWHGVGVYDSDTTGNTIRGNSIHSNGDMGIRTSEGGNEGLAWPAITGFTPVAGTACPNCIIDIYSDEEDEGRVYEGSTTADGDGNWSFPGSPQGPNVTATATDSFGNTSEFSDPVPVPEATPTPSPTPTPTVTPTPGATRTLQWGSGWHNVTWSGASTPEEAFACAAGNYAAAYRLVSGGWERYFPDRPDLSNMADLEQYDAFLILVTGDVTCEMEVADPLGTERTLDWGVGWQNDGWSGADGTTPQDAFACAEGSYAAAYRLVGGGWERHFPDRPDLSNMGTLDEHDAFLILVTAPVSCSMAVGP
ncbi:MAG: right-handed parallel beta-helix repeat-containing protein [Dehalococcoidia bacterium]|nr:MAG: right-handed parallel beta-helix repeat-containing protein [Dehalococcoidia bacterium]